VVNTRQRGRHIAQTLGFDGHEQVRIATAISEVARLAASGANGHIEFLLEDGSTPALRVRVRAPTSVNDGLVSGTRRTRSVRAPRSLPRSG
jgi:hypothetical protein